MIAPPKLNFRDKIVLLAPARWPMASIIQRFCAVLEHKGFTPVAHPQLQARMAFEDGSVGQMAGPDDVRAAALNEALRDPSIKAIFFPRGGTGTYRLLDKIDYDIVAQNPKIIMGYSDLDCLLAAISQRSGLITFRGPMGVNFADAESDPRTERECFELLTGQRTSWVWEGATCLRPGIAEGSLVGGTLSILNAQIGTPFDVDTDGKIIVLEDCDEYLYRIDRFLYQMAAAGKFAKAKAVLFGTLENMADGEAFGGPGTPFGISLQEMLMSYVPAGIPLACGLPLGHGKYLSSHPIGAPVRVEIDRAATRMQLLAPAVTS